MRWQSPRTRHEIPGSSGLSPSVRSGNAVHTRTRYPGISVESRACSAGYAVDALGSPGSCMTPWVLFQSPDQPGGRSNVLLSGCQCQNDDDDRRHGEDHEAGVGPPFGAVPVRVDVHVRQARVPAVEGRTLAVCAEGEGSRKRTSRELQGFPSECQRRRHNRSESQVRPPGNSVIIDAPWDPHLRAS